MVESSGESEESPGSEESDLWTEQVGGESCSTQSSRPE